MTRKKPTEPDSHLMPPDDTGVEAPSVSSEDLPSADAVAESEPAASNQRRTSPPKYQIAEALYRENPGLRRKDYIKLFMEQAGMAPHYAAGFLYHLKRYGGTPEKSDT
jgi:hypothetical protein